MLDDGVEFDINLLIEGNYGKNYLSKPPLILPSPQLTASPCLISSNSTSVDCTTDTV